MQDIKINGMPVEDILRMQQWWNKGTPKPLSVFWEEAFNAGVRQALSAVEAERLIERTRPNGVPKVTDADLQKPVVVGGKYGCVYELE